MDVFDFRQGLPDPRWIATEDLAACAADVLRRDGRGLVRYPPRQGLPALRRVAARRLEMREGCAPRPDDLVVTAGALPAIELAVRSLTTPGDTVLVEERTYPIALRLLRCNGLQALPIPMDDDGVDLGALDGILRRTPRPHLAYLVPSHHNPTGGTLAEERRLPLLRLARRHSLPIIEDDCYADICFERRCPPTLHSLDPSLVIYVGSFSKILAPGFRLGYFVATEPIRSRMMALKNDGGTSDAAAMIAADYLGQRLEAHVAAVAAASRERAQMLTAALGRHLSGSGARWRAPTGGFFCWVALPETVDLSVLAAEAARSGVLFAPGADFDAAGTGGRYLRLCFTGLPGEAIHRGIALLAGCLQTAV